MGFFYIFVPEVFPTHILGAAFGLSSLLAVVGSCLSPYVATWSNNYNINPMFTLGIICLVASLNGIYL